MRKHNFHKTETIIISNLRRFHDSLKINTKKDPSSSSSSSSSRLGPKVANSVIISNSNSNSANDIQNNGKDAVSVKIDNNGDKDIWLASYDFDLPKHFIATSPLVPRHNSKLLQLLQNNNNNNDDDVNEIEVKHSLFKDIADSLHPRSLLIFNDTKVLPARLLGGKFVQDEASVNHKKKTNAIAYADDNDKDKDIVDENNKERSEKAITKTEVLLLQPHNSFEFSNATMNATEHRNNKDQDGSQGNKQCCHWLALVKPGRKFRIGSVIDFDNSGNRDFYAEVISSDPDTGGKILRFNKPLDESFYAALEKYGCVPLPPYIQDSTSTPDQYQTVYAKNRGAVAAPTAGLHFTPELLDKLREKGVEFANLTLHVGVGTFRPVQTDLILSHSMHAEYVHIPTETVAAIRKAKAEGRPIVAVGTTSARALEGTSSQLMAPNMPPRHIVEDTKIFIYPGYKFRVVDGLITNFHLPKSTLLMMVSALIGRERLLSLYELAKNEKYRFFSFGDAMYISPNAVLKDSKDKNIASILSSLDYRSGL